MTPEKETTELLFRGLLIFSFLVVICAILLPENERIYTFLVGVAGGFSGALLTFIKHGDNQK